LDVGGGGFKTAAEPEPSGHDKLVGDIEAVLALCSEQWLTVLSKASSKLYGK
jgi:hypothetical protein